MSKSRTGILTDASAKAAGKPTPVAGNRRQQLAGAVKRAAEKQRMLKQLICTDACEQALRYHGYRAVAGVDEVGRGALFGPVVAAAVILPDRVRGLATAGLKDSKQLSREDRERLDRRIRRVAVAVSVAEVDAATIDAINIYQATRRAMLQAVQSLAVVPDHLLIDAMRVDHPCAQTKLFYGDALSLSIAAASVVAKVHRDGLMRALDRKYPVYGLAAHKGYATPEHRRALRLHGPCALHRHSFAPVAVAAGRQAAPVQDGSELAEDDLLGPLEMLFAAEDLESAGLEVELIETGMEDTAWV